MGYPTTKDGSLTYRTYTELPPIAAFSEQWDTLLQSTPCNRAFSSACWFLSICKSDPFISPCVIAAWRGEQLAGVLPLVQVSDSEVYEFPPFFSDYNDIIVRPGDQPVLEGLLNCALSAGKALMLKNLRLDSLCYRAAAEMSPEIAESLFRIERSCLYI